MQYQNPRSIHLLVAVLVLPLIPAWTLGANNRSSCMNRLHVLALALNMYREAHGSLPTDITDGQGHPLLSWRVRLLPYVLGPSLGEFHRDEAWDSPHNRQFLAPTPHDYRCPSANVNEGATTYLRLLGAPSVLLVEVDAAHAIPWTRPGDLPYDPRAPSVGLANCHGSDSLATRGGFLVLEDGRLRFVPADIDPSLLKAFLSSGPEGPAAIDLPWYKAFFTRPIVWVLWPWFLITICGVTGVGLVLLAFIRGQAVSPGEMLWLVAGVGQLAHGIAVVACYQYEQLPRLGSDQSFWFWFVPSLASTLAALIAIAWFARIPGWRGFFVTAAVIFALYTLDAAASHQHRSTDESFFTASSPLLLAGLATVAAVITLSKPAQGVVDRRRRHWLGIFVCLLPAAFFLIGMVCGAVVPREMFVRVLD